MAVSPRVRRAWMIGGSLVTAGLLVMGVGQVVLSLAHEEYTAEETFDAADISTVVVRNHAGGVRVVGSDPSSDTITVTAEVSDGLRKTGHRERIEGDQLLLEATCPVLSNFCGVVYTIETPSDIDVDVDSSGSIEVSNIEGDVDLDTGESRIEVTEVAGTVRLHSGIGRLSASGLTSSVVEASTTFGSVHLEFASPPRTVLAKSQESTVEVVVPDDGETRYDVGESRSSSGVLSTPISTDPRSARTIKATSARGDVTIRYGN